MLTTDVDGRRITVIDGQQRLATTSLLLAALRDVWVEREEHEQAEDLTKRYLSVFDRSSKSRQPRLMLNEEDDAFFRGLVVDQTDSKPMRESHERLASALKYLTAQLSDDADAHGKRTEERLVAWADFLDQKATVITVTVPSEADAFVIFETLNDRGARLTIGDLLKNFLFMRSKDRLDAVKTSWVQALNELDLAAENDDFVTFLRHHWSSMHGAVRERDMYRAIKDDITTPAKATKYAAQLAEAADLYAALSSPSDAYWTAKHFTSSARANVETLNRLDLEQNRPLLLAVMAHFAPKELRRTFQALVSWSLRGIVVGGIGGGRTEKAYCDAAVKVREGKLKTSEDLLAELSNIVPTDAAFEEAFAQARQTKAAIARYIQLALERAKAKTSEPELVPNANEDQVNLEHILPQRAKSADWPAFSTDQVASMAQRLGNHVLLKKTENAKIGNKAWMVKKPVLAASSLKLTRAASKSANWDPKAIAVRQQALAKLAVATWPRKPPA